jgi:hypothetical protein
MRPSRHTEDAGETADKNVPLQQMPPLESVTGGVPFSLMQTFFDANWPQTVEERGQSL